MSFSTCSLCSIELSQFPIMENDKGFCCAGCHAVYTILAAKQHLDNYQESAIFQQALRAGLISNPHLLDQIRKQKSIDNPQELEKYHLEILDMWCPSCAEVIRLILIQQKGVINCVIDYATDLAMVEFSPRNISKEKIHSLIASIGYRSQTLENSDQKKISLSLYLRFGIASFCALNAMMFAYPLYATYFDPHAHHDGRIFAWLTFFSSLPVVTYCMWPITKRFLSSLRVGLFGMEALVIVGVLSAFCLSVFELLHDSNQVYFDSMSVVIAFVLLGKIIETKAKFSAKESLIRLTKSLPRRGRKLCDDGSLNYVPVKEIQKGDTLVAYTGEKIILDGEVIKGEGSCDESLMTGESFPITKVVGSALLGGSILQNGILTYKVISTAEESALQKIINVVEQDLGYKSSYIRSADVIVKWFVPLILIVALITWISGWLYNNDFAFGNAISVLLIACPCAIGIAAPLAESQLLHHLVSLGVIIRNRGCLSLLPRITNFVFDKTGTVTEGRFKVLEGLQHLSKQEKGILKSLTKNSNHAISLAVFNAIEEECLELSHIEECAGKGMKGVFLNQMTLFGSAKFLEAHHLSVQKSFMEQDKNATLVYFTPDGIKIFTVILGDKIREEIPDIIKKLKAKSILLSGDSQAVVASVAKQCGFEQFRATVSPLEKRAFIEDLRKKGEIVCMIGDGINDAPGLTAAHVGISVVSASDISIQVSDVLLTTENLKVLPKMLLLASFGQRILKQNLFWAFFYNCIGIGLAMLGLLSPIFAAFAMTASSLIVLFNSKRIKLKPTNFYHREK